MRTWGWLDWYNVIGGVLFTGIVAGYGLRLLYYGLKAINRPYSDDWRG